ncbi:hypothetical protein SynM161_02149 [Synechococcus sp. M16.1]|nr:hypothetical protein SynM161_02149 [Synechococcus sp. M16.1]
MAKPPTRPVHLHYVVSNLIHSTNTSGDVPWRWLGMSMTR